jgi:hypothetical protein
VCLISSIYLEVVVLMEGMLFLELIGIREITMVLDQLPKLQRRSVS